MSKPTRKGTLDLSSVEVEIWSLEGVQESQFEQSDFQGQEWQTSARASPVVG